VSANGGVAMFGYIRWMVAAAVSVVVPAGAGWRLAWCDEFDRDGRPDPAVWDYEEGKVRNREAQFYTRNRPENARVENGRLVIEARREPWKGSEWTSASLITLGRLHLRYGRIETRAKLPEGRGVWPALWTMGVHEPPLPWPRRGEIDIMEFVGFDPDVIHTTVHTGRYNHRLGTHKSAKFRLPGVSRDFHVYAVDVRPDHVRFEVDGVERFVFRREPAADIDAWPYDAPQYPLINLAIGGTWGGQKGIDEAMTRARFEVDYVRMFVDDDVPGSELSGSAAGLKKAQ